MTIVEQAAYLKGLVEGLGYGPDSRDGKLWGALTGLLSDMAHEIEDLRTDNLDMSDAMDEICDELNYLEELSLELDTPERYEDYEDYGDSDEDDEEYEDEDDYTPDLRVYDGGDDEDEDEEDEEDNGPTDEAEAEDGEDAEISDILYDVTCPSCGEEITFDEATLDEGTIVCPSCGEILEFDLGDDEE